MVSAMNDTFSQAKDRQRALSKNGLSTSQCVRDGATLMAVFLLPVLVAVLLFHFWIRPHIPDHREQYTAVTAVLKFVTTNLIPMFYLLYAILLIVAIWRKDYTGLHLVLRYIVIQLLISLLVVHTIKNTLGLPRPGHEETKMSFLKKPQVETPDDYRSVLGVFAIPRGAHQSFPSGHTTDILISTMLLALYVRNHPPAWRHVITTLCGLSALLVVFSRLWLERHHAVDTLGGMVLACIGVYLILRKLPARQTTPDPPA